uniref:Uncharacterized protein n=1 Tax=Ciona intestinalis TaxID=7719 RepID=H2XZ49_CIOIN
MADNVLFFGAGYSDPLTVVYIFFQFSFSFLEILNILFQLPFLFCEFQFFYIFLTLLELRFVSIAHFVTSKIRSKFATKRKAATTSMLRVN